MKKVWYNERAVYTDIQEWDYCQEFDKEIHKNLFEQFWLRPQPRGCDQYEEQEHLVQISPFFNYTIIDDSSAFG